MPHRVVHTTMIFLMGITLLSGSLFLCSPVVSAEQEGAEGEVNPREHISDFEARLALARLLSYSAGQIDESIRQYSILIKERPNDPVTGRELADLLIRQRQYPEAMRLLQTVLKNKPGDRAALISLARIYLWTGRNEEALHAFKRLSRRGLPYDVQMDIARAYARNRNYPQAAEIYETLLKSKQAPLGDIYTELGDLHLYSGHIQQAIGAYRNALKISPSLRDARRKLALALSWSGRGEEALPLLRQLNREDVSDREIAIALARVSAASGHFMEASETVRRLMSLFPDDGALVAELADIEAGLGHAGKCRNLYLTALSLTDSNEEIYLRYASQMNLWGDFYGVEAVYARYLETHPADREIRYKLARVLVSAQRYEEAEGIYLNLLQQTQESREALPGLAQLKLLEKDFDRALFYSERLLQAGHQNPDGLFVKAEALYQVGRYNEALPVYKKLAEIEPRQVRGLLGAGKCCLKTGSREQATAFFSKALQVDPLNVESRFWSAWPDKVTSAAFLSDLVRSTGQSPSELAQWARAYESSGYYKMAISCYEEALKQDPEYFPAQIGLAETLAADMQYVRSLDILAKLTEEFPKTSKILFTRARVLGWSRQYGPSLELYDQLCRANPSDPVARKEKARTAAWGKKMDLAMQTYEGAYRSPVDKMLLSSAAGAVAEANDPQLTTLYAGLQESSGNGSVFQGYDAFYEGFDRISARLSFRTATELEQVRRDLLPAYRIQKAAYLEGRSKQLAWNRKPASAIGSYKELIAFQPGNEEARFDHAQAECSLGLCDREALSYRSLLSIDPLHSMAADALERNRIRRNPSIEIDHSYWDEEGRDGLSQIIRNRTDLKFDFPISCRYHFGISAHYWREDPKMRGIAYDAFGHSLQFSGVVNEYVSGAVNWTNKQYVHSGVDSTNTGLAALWFNLRDYARLGIGYERTDELYNNFGIQQGLQADSFWVGASSYLARNFEVKGKAQYTHYSDSNTGQFYLLSAGYDFTDHPRVIRLSIAGEYRDTDLESQLLFRGNDLVNIIHPYWTPQNYFATTAALEWRHDLSKTFFCGSELHYYSLRLGGGTDTEDNPALRVEGEWHYEFKDHWTVALKALLHDSSQWNAAGAWVSLKYQF